MLELGMWYKHSITHCVILTLEMPDISNNYKYLIYFPRRRGTVRWSAPSLALFGYDGEWLKY